MNILIYLITYSIGLASIFIHSNTIIFYFLVFGFLTLLAAPLPIHLYKRLIVEPAYLAIASAFITSFLNNKSLEEYIAIVFLLPYLFLILKGKELNEKKDKENEWGFLIEKIIFPITIPLAICFSVLLWIKSEYIGAILFILLYCFVLSLFLSNIISVRYGSMLLVMEISVLLYLFQYTSFFNGIEKIALLSIVVVAILTHIFLKKRGISVCSIHLKSS